MRNILIKTIIAAATSLTLINCTPEDKPITITQPTIDVAQFIEGYEWIFYESEVWENGEYVEDYTINCFKTWEFIEGVNTRKRHSAYGCYRSQSDYPYTIDGTKVLINNQRYIFKDAVSNGNSQSYSLERLDEQGVTLYVYKFYR